MKKFLICIFCLCCAVYALAQVTLTAKTDKTELAVDDELSLTVQVSGVKGNLVMPQLPSLPAFNVFSREMAQSTVNGQTTLSFKYLMIPRFAGRTTIGPVTFKYNGKTYQTKPINIRIYKSAVPPSYTADTASNVSYVGKGNDSANLPPLEKAISARAYAHAKEPFFIVSAISNPAPYVGETFQLLVRFYYAEGFVDASYSHPSVTDLFMEDKSHTQGRQTLSGIPFNYEEKRYILSAAQAGKATVGPASVTYRTAAAGNSLFDRFFGGAVVSKPVTITSQPISVSVHPLPAGKPASFYGAVGTGFNLTARLDKTETEAEEAVTLSVVVKGPGNLKTTSDLNFPQFNGFTSYPAASESGFIGDDVSRSYKVFQTVLVPHTAGTYTLEGISWSYFDPKIKAYKTLTAPPITLTVTPSSHPGSSLSFGGVSADGSGVQSLNHDIRYVKNTQDIRPTFLYRLSLWKWIHILAFGWLAVCLFMACIGKKAAAKKQAYQHAKMQLKKARTYEHISDALADFLRDKWQISTASLPLKEIVSSLNKHGVSAEDQRAFVTLWKELESARFAPSANRNEALDSFAKRAAQLLKTWEKHA